MKLVNFIARVALLVLVWASATFAAPFQQSPKDFKVEKMTGEIKPGSMLTGRIVGGMGKTTWIFDFDVKLPEKDAAAGMTCGK